MAESDPVVVAGGGLGGMAAALALGRAGIRCILLEQAAALGAIGYGIQLGPNVFWALDALGVAEAVLARSHRPPAILALDARDGTEFVRIPIGPEFLRRFAYPYVVIPRVDLHEILVEACGRTAGVELRSGVSVAAAEQNGDRVEVHSSAGTFAARAFVASDGINSRFRQRLAPSSTPPQPSGYAAHRTIVPREALAPHLFRPEVVLWAGDGFHIVAYPLRDETVYNIVAVFRTPSSAERMGAEAYRSEVQHTYRDAHPDMRALLALMDLERRWPISDQAPTRQWTEGRLTLLGDSAHATLQSLAQGAGMAIEDAVCLANCLSAGSPTQAALESYRRRRLVRTARVQLESRALWHLYHVGGIAADVRRETFTNRPARQYYDCLSWLYDKPSAAMAMPDGNLRHSAA